MSIKYASKTLLYREAYLDDSFLYIPELEEYKTIFIMETIPSMMFMEHFIHLLTEKFGKVHYHDKLHRSILFSCKGRWIYYYYNTTEQKNNIFSENSLSFDAEYIGNNLPNAHKIYRKCDVPNNEVIVCYKCKCNSAAKCSDDFVKRITPRRKDLQPKFKKNINIGNVEL
jgi:hypothetical protein